MDKDAGLDSLMTLADAWHLTTEDGMTLVNRGGWTRCWRLLAEGVEELRQQPVHRGDDLARRCEAIPKPLRS